MTVAQVIAALLSVYAAAGVIFACAFVSFGIARIDGAAAGAPFGFRLIVIPGCAVLWPLLVKRWITRDRGAS
jgi:hypothetical protein